MIYSFLLALVLLYPTFVGKASPRRIDRTNTRSPSVPMAIESKQLVGVAAPRGNLTNPKSIELYLHYPIPQSGGYANATKEININIIANRTRIDRVSILIE